MGFWENARSLLLDTVETIAISLAIFLITVGIFVQPHRVEGSSMSPTLSDQEILLTDKISYRFTSITRGDIVIFHAPPDPRRDYIKRVVGLPGEEISITNGLVLINGQTIKEPYLKEETHGNSFLKEGVTITVGADEYFVMGDNRGASDDSRRWGFVPRKNVIGKAWIRYWPITRLWLVQHQTYQ